MTQQELMTALRARRKAQGITLMEMADRVGLHKSTLSDVENGNRNISLSNLLKITDALGVELSIQSSRRRTK